jgi:Zn-finger protein
MRYELTKLGVRVHVGLQGQKTWSCMKCGSVRTFTPATADALRRKVYSAGCCFSDAYVAALAAKGELPI